MSLLEDLRTEIQKLPVADVHSHLPPERTQAQSPATVLLYHVFKVELVGAGLPRETVARLGGSPASEDFAAWVEHWRLCRATSLGQAVWRTAQDLWGVTGEPSVETLADLWQRGAITAQDLARTAEVFDRCQLVTSLAARPTHPAQQAEPRVKWQLERYVWGPEPARQALAEMGSAAGGFEATYAAWLSAQVEQGASSIATSPPPVPWADGGSAGLRQALNYTANPLPMPPEALGALLCAQARAMLACSQDTGVPLFLALGIEGLDGHEILTVTDSRPFVNWLMLTLKDFPRARVVLMDAHWGTSQSMCMAARQCPKVWVAGHWWQSLYGPSSLEQMRHRLATVPINKVIGFFSDAYCAEWIYARRLLLEEPLAQALAEWVEAGRLSEAGAVEIAAAWMHGNATRLLEEPTGGR